MPATSCRHRADRPIPNGSSRVSRACASGLKFERSDGPPIKFLRRPRERPVDGDAEAALREADESDVSPERRKRQAAADRVMVISVITNWRQS